MVQQCFEAQRNHGLSTQTQGLKTQHEAHQPDATASLVAIQLNNTVEGVGS
jgi:hypothetical protein